jgi:serine/threonine-protein kinase HipA
VYKPVAVIEVRIWDQLVGAVAKDEKLNCYAFEYAKKFSATTIELAPLQMPLSKSKDIFAFTDLRPQTYKRLPALLADALPDDFGNGLIDAYLATKGIAKDDITALDRLAYMGKRGMGALEFKPVVDLKKQPPTAALTMCDLVESARHAATGRFDNEDNEDNEDNVNAALINILQVGTSAGGARAKAVIAWNEATGEIRPGQFGVENGFVHWLLKFDGIGANSELGSKSHYGRIEYAYYLMALQAGVTMNPCRLMEEDGRAHFMTQRFDRNGNVRHHIQTLCAMSHLDYRQKSTHDYSQYFMAIAALHLPIAAREEAFRRMVLNVLSANCDDHTKNFSFLLKNGGSWELAPAYDVTHAHNPRGGVIYEHLMSVNGKFHNIQKSDLMTVADRFQVPRAKAVLKEVTEAVDAWAEFAKKAEVQEQIAAKIRNDHRQRRVLNDATVIVA